MKVTETSLMDPAVQADPSQYHNALLAEAPVYFMPEINAYVVSAYKDIQYVVVHPELWSIDFRSRPDAQMIRHPKPRELLAKEGFIRDTKLTTDPPAHTQYRAAVSKTFSPSRVKAQTGFIQGAVDELVGRLVKTDHCEFMSTFAWHLPIRVITKLLGVPYEDADRIKHWSDVWVEPMVFGLSEEREMVVAREEIALQKYLVQHMQSKLENPGDDILTELANAKMADGSPMTLADKVGLAEHLIVGGHETATSALGSGMMILARRPDIAEELRRDLSRVDNFVEEVLRLESPSQGFFRVAVQDAELGGVKIPKGAMVHLRFAAANRDPTQFKNPSELNLARGNPRSHLAFSYGIHHCLGAPYARLELQTAFRAILERLEDIALDANAAPPEHILGLSLRTLKHLHVTYRVRAQH
jgi:cytochrome P450